MINPADEILVGEEKFNIIDNTDGTKTINLANTVVKQGTNINRDLLNDLQGMAEKRTVFTGDSLITETSGNVTKTTTFNSDGSITEVITGGDSDTSTTKITVFDSSGNVTESIVAGGE